MANGSVLQTVVTTLQNVVQAINLANQNLGETLNNIKPTILVGNPSASSGPLQAIGLNAPLAFSGANLGTAVNIVTSGYVTGISLVSATPANLTSVVLTSGTWELWGTASCEATISVSAMDTCASETSATVAPISEDIHAHLSGISAGASTYIRLAIGMTTLKISSTTTVYLVLNAVFSGTGTGAGIISARQVG